MSGIINSSLQDSISQSTSGHVTTTIPTTSFAQTTTLAPTTTNITTSTFSSTTTNISTTTGIFNPKSVADAWEHNKVTVTWLIPVVVVVVVLMVMLSLAIVYMIRGMELWVLKCCHRNCCCPNSSRRLETEYTHLTAALHEDHEAVTLTGMEGREADTWEGNRDKQD